MLGSKTVTKLMSWINGRHVGTDAFQNQYFESKHSVDAFGRMRRWVIYQGTIEPSKIPSQWHGWLHHTVDKPVDQAMRPWKMGHLPYLTGTAFAYFPQQPTLTNGRYEAWTPQTPSNKQKRKNT